MESLFEPSSYLDPTPYDPSSFLTFSSFADLTASPPSISDTWDDVFVSSPSSFSSSSFSPSPFAAKALTVPVIRSAHSASSDCSSPDLSFDPFEISYSAFEAAPGIFHTPSKSYPLKLSASDTPAPGLTHRVSVSTDSNWDSPLITPSLNGPGFATPPQQGKSSFSWEDAHATLGSSSSYTPPTTAVSPVPLRVASNPSLGAAKNPRAIRPVNSMPALKEEVDTFQWFDGSNLVDSEPVTDEALVDNFDWVFGDFGLGDNLPIEGTIFAAFRENEQEAGTPVTSASTSGPLPSESTFTSTHTSPPPSEPTDNQYTSSWYNPNSEVTQAVSHSSIIPVQNYDYTQMYTIDPLVLSGSANGVSRPSSAPGAEAGEGIMLSAPMAGQMSRSLTAPGYVPRHAPSSEVYSYNTPPTHFAPQQPQAQQQSPYITAQGMPMRSLPQRRGSHGLSISVNPPSQSTYIPSADFPTPPHSAPFTSSSMVHAQAQAQSAYSPQVFSHLQAPVAMVRAGTQPLPTRRGSASGHAASASTSSMPAHLVRAQAIVQMQEAKEEAQRQELRRQAASRRVGMAEASVMQPLTTTAPQPPPHFPPTQPRSQPAITGWGGPSSLPSQSHMPSGIGGSHGPLTSQPLIVHPPPSYYAPGPAPAHTYHPQSAQSQQPQQHRVHPPPHPGMGPGVGLGMAIPRPMARLPSSPTKRKVTSPSKRSPSGSATKARRAPMQAGGFSWGEATFINFTPDDAEKLLTGVAPSGSQAKRKREEDIARGAAGLSLGAAGGLLAGPEYVAVDMDREGSKRSRSGE